MKISDESLAFDLDRACTFELSKYDQQFAFEQLKAQMQSLGALLGGKPENDARKGNSDDEDDWNK